eukprot:1097877-Pelagomonas_calceolata.AAC.3
MPTFSLSKHVQTCAHLPPKACGRQVCALPGPALANWLLGTAKRVGEEKARPVNVCPQRFLSYCKVSLSAILSLRAFHRYTHEFNQTLRGGIGCMVQGVPKIVGYPPPE